MEGRRFLLDQGVWKSLVRRIARATRRPDKAEDLLQSAFLRLEGYAEQENVRDTPAFLVRTAVNLAVDQGRSERARGEIYRPVQDLIDRINDEPLQDEVLLARKRLQRVEAGLSELSPRTREIFLMHRIEGMKYREIAAVLGITVSAVEKHVAKAMLFLAEWTEGW